MQGDLLFSPPAWPHDVTPVKVVRAARGSTFPVVGLPLRGSAGLPLSGLGGDWACLQRPARGARHDHRANSPGRGAPAPLIMKTNETPHSPGQPDRQPNQLYAPNGRRIAASKDWIPGNALIASVTREPDGTVEIEWEGETKLCWDGQHTEQLGERRIFLDDAGNEWREDQLALGTEPFPTLAEIPAAGDDAWAAIPHYPIGQVPEALPDENPALYRQVIAKRAILAACENSEDPEAGVTDLLADLRHLCDGLGWDFATLDGAAYRHYAEEKSGDAK